MSDEAVQPVFANTARQPNTSPHMTSSRPAFPRSLPIGWIVGLGLVLLAAAWSVPVNLQSVTPPLLERAGEATPTVAQLGRQWLDREKPGPAALAIAAARTLGDPKTQNTSYASSPTSSSAAVAVKLSRRLSHELRSTSSTCLGSCGSLGVVADGLW